MGNYSKKEVRKSQGEAPKVKFRPIDKTVSKPVSLNKYLENGHQESKHVPLNMLMKVSEKLKPNGIEEVFYQDLGTSGICSRAEAYEDNLAMDGEVPSYQESEEILSNICGGHYCLVDSATWSHLSAGAFKAPGGCSGCGVGKKVESRFDRAILNPLRNEDMDIEAIGKTLNLFFKEPSMKELNPAISHVEDGGWQRIRGVMDSGASESVAHPSMCPQYRVKPSAGSTAGQKYVSASGDVIANLGE
jgi:hypothetical protein